MLSRLSTILVLLILILILYPVRQNVPDVHGVTTVSKPAEQKLTKDPQVTPSYGVYPVLQKIPDVGAGMNVPSEGNLPKATDVSPWYAVYSQVSNKPAKLKISDTLSVRDPGSWKPLHRGIEYRQIMLERSDPDYSFELKLFRFDSQSVTARILPSSQYQLNAANVKTLAQRSGAIAAINGNYFDDRGRALGFLKTGAQQINRYVSRSSLFTGLFGIRNLLPFIVHRDQFESAQADEALQSGPLLLRQGRALEVVRGYGRYSRRSVIGIDNEQRLIIGITAVVFGGLSWAELQEIFSSPRWELQTPDLLNLDGGGSAQFYLKTAKLEEFIPGTSEVPVAIGFFNK